MRRRTMWRRIGLATAVAAVVAGAAFVVNGGLDRMTTVSAGERREVIVDVRLVDSFGWYDVVPDVVEVRPGPVWNSTC